MNEEEEGQCWNCGRTLPSGLWFARIQRHGRTVEFCRPRCLEAFLNTPAGEDGGFKNRDATSPLLATTS